MHSAVFIICEFVVSAEISNNLGIWSAVKLHFSLLSLIISVFDEFVE